MKLERACRKCELERELAMARGEERERVRAELAKERHTCRNPRNNRTRGA